MTQPSLSDKIITYASGAALGASWCYCAAKAAIFCWKIMRYGETLLNTGRDFEGVGIALVGFSGVLTIAFVNIYACSILFDGIEKQLNRVRSPRTVNVHVPGYYLPPPAPVQLPNNGGIANLG